MDGKIVCDVIDFEKKVCHCRKDNFFSDLFGGPLLEDSEDERQNSRTNGDEDEDEDGEYFENFFHAERKTGSFMC